VPPPLTGIAKLAHSAPSLLLKNQAEYFQIPTYELLNRCTSTRMPFEWTINPYRGCEFGCKYCYARYTHEFMEFHDPADFERKIFAKQWNPAAFRDRLRKIDPAQRIAIGTATDPYQPAERKYNLTRSILEVFASLTGRQLSLVTKSDLVKRDADLLASIARRNKLYVSLTVTTTDAELARILEPMAPRPDLRLDAVKTLSQAQVPVGVLCCPLLPLINDREPQLNSLAAAAKQAGAQWLASNVVFLTEPARRIFFPFLAEKFPHLERRYREKFSRNAYLRGEYPKMLQNRFRRIRAAHGLTSRFPDYQPGDWAEAAPQQLPLLIS
jgi:DNA repair photolyase